MTKNLTPHILAIETSTSACSVALGLGDDLIFKRSQVGNNIHSQVLLTMVQEVLEEASFSVNGLNAVAVGQGPGSFTGLRIGVGVAQGIAYGVGCPMIGVSSLMALAFQSREEGLVIAALDARMGEVYWGCYNNECNRADSKDERSRLYGDMLVSKPEAMTRQRLVELLGAEFINKPFLLAMC